MRELAVLVPRNAAKILQKTALKAGSAVVKTTPVDTGLARSNWLAAVNAQDLTPRTPRTASSTINEIAGVVATASADSEIHITNGGDKVPYLERLNRGSSFQAPANFVRIALMLARASLTDGSALILGRRRRT